MFRLTKYSKTIKYNHIRAMLIVALLVFVVWPGVRKPDSENNLVTIFYLVFDSVSFSHNLFTLIVKQVNYLLSSVFHGGSV